MVTPGILNELLKSKLPVFTPPDGPKYIGGWLLDVDMMRGLEEVMLLKEVMVWKGVMVLKEVMVLGSKRSILEVGNLWLQYEERVCVARKKFQLLSAVRPSERSGSHCVERIHSKRAY
jgi:hypothetical protein